MRSGRWLSSSSWTGLCDLAKVKLTHCVGSTRRKQITERETVMKTCPVKWWWNDTMMMMMMMMVSKPRRLLLWLTLVAVHVLLLLALVVILLFPDWLDGIRRPFGCPLSKVCCIIKRFQERGTFQRWAGATGWASRGLTSHSTLYKSCIPGTAFAVEISQTTVSKHWRKPVGPVEVELIAN